MMNSYELEQPLDLRLKALNLSLNTFHHSTSPSITSDSSTSNDSLKSVGTTGSPSSAFSNGYMSPPAAFNQAHQISTSLPHHQHNQYHHHHQLLNAHHNHLQHLPPPTISLTSQPLQTINQGQQQSHNTPPTSAIPAPPPPPPQQHHSHLRSANIHCQPLNHHQPHPLSRLHPIPNHVEQQQASPQASGSHQQNSLPPRQFSSPQQHFYSYPMPTRSLSMSNHHHQHHLNSASLLQHQAGANQTSSATLSNKPAQSNENNVFSKQIGDTVVLNRNTFFKDLNASSPPSSIKKMSSSPPSTSASSSPTNSSLLLNTTSGSANNSSQSFSDNSNSAPQITRQHSLVSRYNCKPCGIVFSQLETLRAHQEGYCTKRDRTQMPQVRSQSAVSPVVVSQQQQQQQQQQNQPAPSLPLSSSNQSIASQ